MRVVSLGFLIGVVLLQQLATVPPVLASISLLVLIPLAFYFPRWRFLLCIGTGFLWASAMAHFTLVNSLDASLEGKDLVVEGYISSLPEKMHRRVQFHFNPVSIRKDGIPKPLSGKILLNWYGFAPNVKAGEFWRLQVRLKRPHGFMNPGGFDYEGWLFQQGIRAKGYVRKANDINRRLSDTSYTYPMEQFRQALRDRLLEVIDNHPLRGIVSALALGDRQYISMAQWEVLTRTGTSHLVAISGLHVGLVAGFAFFVASRMWRFSARAVTIWPASRAGALFALMAASFYALLAGFSIPTQRALVMVVVVMVAIMVQRRIRPSNLLALALLLVLVLDPLAVLSPGFWLSFAAVAVILYGMAGRVGKETSWRKWWWQWGRVQWLVTLGLFPVLILLFQKASLVSPLANIVAVPWVSLVTVPLVLTGVVFLTVAPALANILLGLAIKSLEGLWWFLQNLGDWSYSQWYQGMPEPWVVIGALFGVILMLAPRGIPGRWVGTVWLLPIIFTGGGDLAEGEAQFALLDVGQGLSAVVRTQNHTLVFDTGPRFSSGFNTGGAVVAPYLRARGVHSIDTLVISHGDNDHVGGAIVLASQVPVKRTISSIPDELETLAAVNCLAGDHWQWDGVSFEVLNPATNMPRRKGRKANNRSCVLRVQAGKDSVLLTGDIERGTEQWLVSRYREKLASTVMVIPHHGSKTSSSPAFIDVVSPEIAMFPVGYRNRYGFPRDVVVRRYESRKVSLFDSARHGCIELRLGGSEKPLKTIQTWRQSGAHYWHNQSQSTFSVL